MNPLNRQRLEGTISFGRSTIGCIARQLTRAGATLQVATPCDIPDTFGFLVRNDPLRRDCKVIWRGRNMLGVIFEQR